MAYPLREQRTYSGPTHSQGGAVFNGDLHAARDININHITTLRPVARSLYRSCLTSSDLFKQVQNELGALLAMLETTEDHSNELHLNADRHPQLSSLSRDCHKVLQDLQCLKAHFDGVGTQCQLTWERMGWGTDELAEIRSRLVTYIGMLGVINSNTINSSQARIEQMLMTFINEVRTGKREGSVVSTQTTGSLSADEKEAWRQLRKELESVGISSALSAQHRLFIVATLQKAFSEEDLAGDIPCIYDSSASSELGQEGFEASSTPGVRSSAEPNAKHSDEPLQQPIQDRISSNKVPDIDSPRRSKDVGRIARLIFRITNSRTAILEAAKSGDAVLVKRLLNKGAAVDSKENFGRTPLSWAAEQGYELVVKLLLDKGAAVDPKDHGESPLLRAARNGHKVVVKLLLDKGAAVDSKDCYGWTPLHSAAYNGHEKMAKLLLDKGAAVDSKDKLGRTPLYRAAYTGHEEVVMLLLDRGAAVDSKDKERRAPLWYAAQHGSVEVVKLLLDRGADIDSIDRNGWTPLSVAVSCRHKAVIQLLRDKEAANSSRLRAEGPL